MVEENVRFSSAELVCLARALNVRCTINKSNVTCPHFIVQYFFLCCDRSYRRVDLLHGNNLKCVCGCGLLNSRQFEVPKIIVIEKKNQRIFFSLANVDFFFTS